MLAAISKRNFGVRADLARALAARVGLCTAAGALVAACARSAPTDPAPPNGLALPSAALAPAASARPAEPERDANAANAANASDASELPVTSSPSTASRPIAEQADGPHALPLAAGRTIFYALPREGSASRAGARPWRLVGHLHGICYPPSYSAGRWLGAAVDVGVLVTPTGNAHCGDSDNGPPSWEAPSWDELVAIMDGDLERSIAKVGTRHQGAIRREGAVLTGFSRGAYAAPVVARMHPGRWPYLVLIEANVPVSAAGLRKAGVRAVAFVAGELGTEIAGMRKADAELRAGGFPSRLFVMPRVGHLYPDDMETIMADALAFVLSNEP